MTPRTVNVLLVIWNIFYGLLGLAALILLVLG